MYTDQQIREWAIEAANHGGSFIQAIGASILRADDNNFALLRPVAVQLVAKYPKYLENSEKGKA